jgi:DNA-binding response OmpR family regulator
MMKNRHTILVVDDDPKVLELIEAMLIPAGYYVVTLVDSTKMVDTVREVQPDLILLDIMMPFEDGYTILNKLKKGADRSNIPIVMVSAVADDGHKVIASIDGASAYITKPIDRKVLLETIAHFLPDSES